MRWKATLLIFALAVMGVGTLTLFATTSFERRDKAPVEEEERPAETLAQPLVTFIDPSKGPAEAEHLVVEFGNFTCPYCRETDKDVKRLLSARTDVRYVWKTLPDLNFPDSQVIAEAGQCAHDQGKFWEFKDRLFEGGASGTQAEMAVIAQELELDVEAFNTCQTTHAGRPAIDRNVSEAQALGIDALPYFFVDGKRLSGQRTYDQLAEALR